MTNDNSTIFHQVIYHRELTLPSHSLLIGQPTNRTFRRINPQLYVASLSKGRAKGTAQRNARGRDHACLISRNASNDATRSSAPPNVCHTELRRGRRKKNIRKSLLEQLDMQIQHGVVSRCFRLMLLADFTQ